jgi:chaperone modulatory protein CbpM
MKPEQTESVWLDAHCEYSFAEIVRCSGLSEAELRELVDYGVLSPSDPRGAEWTFGGDVVATIQAARRLHEDLELDPQALALALTLIGRIHELEAELRSLRAQLPRRSA